MNLGLIRGEPIASYHATDAVGHGKLETFRDADRGPARYYGQYVAKTIPPREATDAMDIGQALDSLVLEKKTVFDALPLTYMGAESKKAGAPLVEKPWNMNSHTCQAIDASIRARGLIPLHADDARLVWQMRDAVMANETAAALLSAGEPQVTMRHQLGRFAVQVRPDWFCEDGQHRYLCDLKSAEDMDQFLKNRRAYGYSRQAALYREVARLVLADMGCMPPDLVAAPDFFFIVVFKTAPIQCAVFCDSPAEMEAAKNEVVDDLRYLKRCYETNNWPGVHAGVGELPDIWRKAA